MAKKHIYVSVLPELFSGFAYFTFTQVTGALSEGLSTVHMDSKHNTKRQQIRSSATSSTSQFMSGLKGLGHGLYGGVKSIIKPFEGAAEGGIEVRIRNELFSCKVQLIKPLCYFKVMNHVFFSNLKGSKSMI